jgi:raffinose/stachyose/melibiose transport system substrate-binding protein
LVSVIAALLIVGVLAAASYGRGGNATKASAASATTTLNFTSLAQGPGIEGAWKDLINAFQREHPNIKVVRTPVPYGGGGGGYRTTVKLHAAAPDAPDLVEGDMGPGGVMASLESDGLLQPLDSYAAQYAWAHKFGPFLAQLRLAADGQHIGTGHVYGVPDFAEILGIFYNKKILARLHLRLPSTFAQYEAALHTAKSAGVTPMLIGGSDQFPWSHLYDVLADHFGSPQNLINWFRGKPSASIVSPGMMTAGQIEQSWFTNGYFEAGANGVSDAEAVTRFDHGQSLFQLNGPWDTQQNVQALGKNVGWFLMPPVKAGTLPASTGWMGWSVGVTAHSQHKTAAAQFVNFLTTPAARAIFMAHYNPPGTPGTMYTSKTSPIVRAIGVAFNNEVKHQTLVPYMDVGYPQAAPYNMLANAQSMAAGQMSVAQFLHLSQQGWATYHGHK